MPEHQTLYYHRVDQIITSGDEAFRVTAFVLAGGKSTRMGKNKAFLELGDRTLLARALDLAGSVAGDVRIVGDAGQFASFGPVVEDIYRNSGPLGGIHAALVSTTTELNLMLAVDLPFLEPRFLKFLISQAQETRALVTVPSAAGGLQPLCAVYRQGFAEIAERSLQRQRNKIDALFPEVETRVLGEGELQRSGFSPGMFRNLNTPEQWEEAKSGGW